MKEALALRMNKHILQMIKLKTKFEMKLNYV